MYKISIIMPAYNSEHHIGKSINSVLAQSYKNFELIIINDGSTDSTEDIILDLKREDQRIKYIKTKNYGSAHARNVGLEKSTGDFISFVDSDDYIDENMLEILISNYNKFYSEIIACGIEKIPSTGNRNSSKSSIKNRYYSKWDLETEIYPHLFSTKSLDYVIPKSMVAKLYKRELIEDNSIRFLPGLKYEEDLIFTETCLLYSNSFYYLPEKKLYKYVYNSSSITHRYIERLWENSKKGVYQRKLISDKFTQYNLKSQLPYVLIRNAMTAIANIGRNDRASRTETIKEISKVINDPKLQKALAQVNIKQFNFIRRILSFHIQKKHPTIIYFLLKGYRLIDK